MAKVTAFSNLISTAIRTRRLLGLNHRFCSMIVEPYALGQSSNGVDSLLAWQVNSGDAEDSSNGWKIFPIVEIAGLRVLPHKYLPVHENEMPSSFVYASTILVNFFLNVQSSYSANTEAPATARIFDTVQFYSDSGKNWLIKTFATDQDVHIWSLSPKIKNIVDLALSSTEKHYGDVLSECYIFEASNGLQGVRSELIKYGIPEHLESTPEGCVFWAPEGSHYSRTSIPQTIRPKDVYNSTFAPIF